MGRGDVPPDRLIGKRTVNLLALDWAKCIGRSLCGGPAGVVGFHRHAAEAWHEHRWAHATPAPGDSNPLSPGIIARSRGASQAAAAEDAEHASCSSAAAT